MLKHALYISCITYTTYIIICIHTMPYHTKTKQNKAKHNTTLQDTTLHYMKLHCIHTYIHIGQAIRHLNLCIH